MSLRPAPSLRCGRDGPTDRSNWRQATNPATGKDPYQRRDVELTDFRTERQDWSVMVRRLRFALSAVALGLFAQTGPLGADVAKITQFPMAIICEFSGIEHVFYLSKLQTDGVAVYQRPDGVLGTISLSGPSAVMGGDGQAKGSCGGKTLEELRAAGQAVEFK
jgi:hypothetical protein